MGTKKIDFKANPALSFITAPEPEESAEQAQEPPKVSAPVQKTDESAQESTKANAPVPNSNTPPAGYKMNPMYVETKSRRLQLVLQPSLYERVKKAAQNSDLSVNEYVHQILDQATPKE